MKTISVIAVLLIATALFAQADPNEAAIRTMIEKQTAAWNHGDADAYAALFAPDGTFTNLAGMFFTGRKEFRERHDQIFKTVYRGSVKREEIVSIKFVRPDVAIVDTLQTITGFKKLLPGTSADSKGRLRTRLLQVMVKDAGEWKIAAYHNVDVKPGTVIAEDK